MKRREFLKSTMLFAAVSTVVGKAAGIFSEAAAATFVAVGKLGYKEVSPQAGNGKQCNTCKHYKANAAAGAGAGECSLPAMQTAMKTKPVMVKDAAYCNMWAKKA
ncbi:MAG: hypothetical protein AB7I27_14700 [Bacteriovoracaceae bacterium]